MGLNCHGQASRVHETMFLCTLQHGARRRILGDEEERLGHCAWLKERMGKLCKAYFEEAKWFHHGQTPKLQEYLENGWVSISNPIMLFNAYCMGKDLTGEALMCCIHLFLSLNLCFVAFSKSDPLRRGKVAEEIPDKRGCFLTFDALFHCCGIASSLTAKTCLPLAWPVCFARPACPDLSTRLVCLSQDLFVSPVCLSLGWSALPYLPAYPPDTKSPGLPLIRPVCPLDQPVLSTLCRLPSSLGRNQPLPAA
ncbi:hypothetical protein ZIOFF_024208 [Zingiber officinale]|uniref:Terpene synthase metal-binding domain-containing protein n=1 Tax=Zingiber officinale TaxID=94328 RepID=A0A8J5LDD3_ZINOF|nr:hypothetical protein ZIOFF_024208 [Zingiber officinale]